MPRRSDLPPGLQSRPFTTADGLAKGLSPDRLRNIALSTPFHGIKAARLDVDRLEDLCRAFATRMPTTGAFSHATAAQLWNIPLPLRLERELKLHVSVVAPARAPRRPLIVGHQRSTAFPRQERLRLPVVTAPHAWCDLGEMLALHDLVAAGDYVLTGDPYLNVLPLASLDQLEAAVAERAGVHGAAVLRHALSLVAEGPLSRPESLTRLILARAGLPHPLINEQINDAEGFFLAIPDLSWPEYKVALEYEGEYHRQLGQFRRDVLRVERLVDHEWLIVKAVATDVFDEPQGLVDRVARRLNSRGWDGSALHLAKTGFYER